MAITDRSQWSGTAASNTDLNSIPLGESLMFPANINNAFRELMAQVAVSDGQNSAVASATTTDIGAATGWYLHITGTTTITALGTEPAGAKRFVVFDAALTLTHNATSLILPGGANITTAAGDTAIFVSEGSGNWRCLAYSKASGKAVTGGTPAVTVDNTIPRFDGTAGALQTSTAVIADDGSLSITSTASSSQTNTWSDDGAGVGPTFDLYRISASPATDDVMGAVNFYGRDSAGNKELFAAIRAGAKTVTSGAEQGTLNILADVGGVLTSIASASGAAWTFPSAVDVLAFTASSVTTTGSGNINAGGQLNSATYSATGASTGFRSAAGQQLSSQTLTTAVAHYQFFNPNGQVGVISTNGSATTYATASDATLKADDGEMPAELAEQILSLVTIHDFRWKVDGTPDHGVFAQELHPIYPQAVFVGGWRDPRDGSPCDEHDEGAEYQPWSVDYSKLVTPILRVTQSLMSRVSALEAALNARK